MITPGKILNDPIYGFINMPQGLLFKLIEHPYFQRMRRISQLGLTNMVYPGAIHTRFQHALGATHLMQQAIDVIKSKGHQISEAEEEAVLAAILLHDVGHGPFSHSLEKDIVEGVSHELISLIFMDKLNIYFDGRLSLAIEIFRDKYHKKFLHQLVSSQLDMDRLDYLMRDSFFTGVSEGVIGYDRIIKMLDVVDDELVVEAKGIYSIEKFLISRRLMYWQVYLHKTVLAAEQMLVKILRRAKKLSIRGVELFATPSLKVFLDYKINADSFRNADKKKDGVTLIEHFANLDDNDLISAIKVWARHEDKALSWLCSSLISRKLYKIEIQKEPFSPQRTNEIKARIIREFKISENELEYYLFEGSISNNAYRIREERINILNKSGDLTDITSASDVLNVEVLDKDVEKFFICYPKEL